MSSYEAAVGKDLERLVLLSIEAGRLQDWEYKTAPEWVEHVDHKNFRFKTGTPMEPLKSWNEAIEYWKQGATEDPTFNIEVEFIMSQVNEKPGRASVHTHMIMGHNDLRIGFQTEHCWKRNMNGKWLCYELSGVRGTEI